MKLTKLTWGMTILGLGVGLHSPAMAEQEKVKAYTERTELLAKAEIFSNKRIQVSKQSSASPSLKVVDDQLSSPAKISKPLYQPPRRGAPGGRVGGGTRGPAMDAPLLYALVPDHVAISAEEQPSFVWYLSQSTALPLEFTVVEAMGIEPMLETPLPSPQEAGIHMISLAQYGLRLESGKTYQWFVSLIPDPTRRSQDIIAGGLLEVGKLSDELTDTVKPATPLDATKFLAKAGFWYDAMAVITKSIQANPTDQALREVRAALLEQVGLKKVAKVDRQRDL